MKKHDAKWAWLILIALMVIFIPWNQTQTEVPDGREDMDSQAWQETYETIATKDLAGYESFVENTEYYDYDDPLIIGAANEIARKSSDEEEATINTLKYVYDRVQYVWGEADDACYKGVAPEILNSGQGQCDTMSITVTSILRKMGIAAQPVGGCILVNNDCRLQSVFLNSFQYFKSAPRFTPLEDLSLTGDTFSRRDEFARLGGLHAWVTVWLPNRGWVALEPTAGIMADVDCYYYHVELFPENDRKDDICVSKSYEYASACKFNDIESLDQYGEGLTGEVQP